MKTRFLTVLLAAMLDNAVSAQILEKMNWFNEPSEWNIDGDRLTMSVTPKSDYWRISHYGFTVDDAPFYYAEYGGEFEVKAVRLNQKKVTRLNRADL